MFTLQQLCGVNILCCVSCFKGCHESAEGTASMVQVINKQAYLKPTTGGAVFISFYVYINGKRQNYVEGIRC